MSDEQLQCSDCGNWFVFTERDQKFFAEKNFSKPKRCKACRIKKRVGRER